MVLCALKDDECAVYIATEMQSFFHLVKQSYILVHFKQDFGLYHQFVQTMNDRFCSDKLSPWLCSNLAALTVSCFEIRKHVIYSPALTAAIIDSQPFNTTLFLRNDLKPKMFLFFLATLTCLY